MHGKALAEYVKCLSYRYIGLNESMSCIMVKDNFTIFKLRDDVYVFGCVMRGSWCTEASRSTTTATTVLAFQLNSISQLSLTCQFPAKLTFHKTWGEKKEASPKLRLVLPVN